VPPGGHRVAAEAGTVREALPLAQSASYDLALLDVNLNGEIATPVAGAIAVRASAVHIRQRLRMDGVPSGFRGAPYAAQTFSGAWPQRRDRRAAMPAVRECRDQLRDHPTFRLNGQLS
jgi:hypothetical protein